MKIIEPHFEIWTELDEDKILKHLEKVGRVCYKSEDKITEDSAAKFIGRLISHEHLSMIEHYNITVKFFVDRGISHEIVRHRVASYAQESTRYVNFANEKYSKNINIIDIKGGMNLDPKVSKLPIEKFNEIYDEWYSACQDAENHYNKMIELGATPQIARSVLPTSTKTELVATYNIREWRHFLKLRTSKPAHPQIREVTIQLLKEFQKQMPTLFGDIEIDE